MLMILILTRQGARGNARNQSLRGHSGTLAQGAASHSGYVNRDSKSVARPTLRSSAIGSLHYGEEATLTLNPL
jgi:hypothetical protein